MSWGQCVGVVGRFLLCRAWWLLSVRSGIPFVGCNFMNVEVMERCMQGRIKLFHKNIRNYFLHFYSTELTGSNHFIILLSS